MQLAILTGWKIIDFSGEYYAKYWNYAYIDFMTRKFRKIYLIAPIELSDKRPTDSYLLNFENLHVIHLPPYSHYLGGMRHFRSHYAAVKNLQHIDYFYCTVPNPYCWLPALIAKRKVIMHYVGDSIDALRGNSRYGLLRKILYVTAYLPEYILCLLASKRSAVYTNGPHLQRKLKKFRIDSIAVISSTLREDEFYQKDFKPARESIKLLYVGFIRYGKGLETLIQAADILKQEGINVQLNLVGQGENQAHITRLSQELGIEKIVHYNNFIGNRARLLQIYRENDIFLFPSLSEGSPRAVLEAMANSLPVVSTPVGSLPWTFENNKEIKLCDFSDAEEFAEKILEYISTPSRTQEIILRAYEKVKNNYTLEKYMTKVFEKCV
jgi:glycosyltransferase involved in cell wall biosynthesis